MMSVAGVVVELIALAFVVAATARLPWYWHLEHRERPTAFVWSERTWKHHVRAIVPSVLAGWALVLAFPAAWYSDQSSVASAILVAGGTLVLALAVVGAITAFTGWLDALVPPPWRE
jgi:hypothetical protein